MYIKVKLFSSLSKYKTALDKNGKVILPPDAKVADLLRELGIDHSLVMVVAVNGETAGDNTVLKNGDEVSMFPMIDGG